MDSKETKRISQMKVAIASAIVGAIVGSILTFSLPLLFKYFTQPPQPLQPPKVINISAKELVDWYKKIDNKVQAEELAKSLYYGKYVQWTGIIQDITPSFKGAMLNLKLAAPAKWPYLVIASIHNREEVSTLSKGKKVVVIGKISNISEKFGIIVVLIDDSRIVEVIS